MTTTRANGITNYPQDDLSSTKQSRRKLRRIQNKQARNEEKKLNQANFDSKHMQDQLRRIWDFETRQSRRWLVAKQQQGLFSWEAAKILHKWLKAKTPDQKAELPNLSQKIFPSDDFKEAWQVWNVLKKERATAMLEEEGPTCTDWWLKGSSEGDEGMEEEDGEDEVEEDVKGGAIMSVVDEGDEEDEEEGGVQLLEPPEPVSPQDFGRYYAMQM